MGATVGSLAGIIVGKGKMKGTDTLARGENGISGSSYQCVGWTFIIPTKPYTLERTDCNENSMRLRRARTCASTLDEALGCGASGPETPQALNRRPLKPAEAPNPESLRLGS